MSVATESPGLTENRGLQPGFFKKNDGLTIFLPSTALQLSVWGVYTLILWLCTFSTNLIFSATFLTLAMLFFFLAGGQTNANFMKFAGAWGILVVALAWYLATAMLLTDLYGRSVLPLFPFRPINNISGGTLGTRRRVDDPEESKA